MASLHVKFLSESAKAPTVAHPGEDIGYDLYASQPCTLLLGQVQALPRPAKWPHTTPVSSITPAFRASSAQLGYDALGVIRALIN